MRMRVIMHHRAYKVGVTTYIMRNIIIIITVQETVYEILLVNILLVACEWKK